MNVFVYDIEVFINCFTITFRNIETDEIKYFVIFNEKNDLYELLEFLKNVKGLIGYNNLRYDYPIIHFIIGKYNEFERSTVYYITQSIYNKSQEIINAQYSEIRSKLVKIPQLDLYRIWHFDNKNKATSLKHVEIAINFPNVEDFPYEHDHYVLPNQLDGILSYNLNDVNATYEFYKITKGQTELKLFKDIDRIQLRKDIQKEYGFDCLNFNDVKIGDKINQVEYLKQKPGLTSYDLRNIEPIIKSFTFGECIPDYIQFQTEELNKFYNNIKNIQVIVDQKQTFPIIFRGTKYIIAKGGIHSKDKPRILKSDENIITKDGDIGSQYPNAIAKRKLYPLHLGIEWLKGFIGNIIKRMAAKSKEIKRIADALKLALNGGGFSIWNKLYLVM